MFLINKNQSKGLNTSIAVCHWDCQPKQRQIMIFLIWWSRCAIGEIQLQGLLQGPTLRQCAMLFWIKTEDLQGLKRLGVPWNQWHRRPPCAGAWGVSKLRFKWLASTCITRFVIATVARFGNFDDPCYWDFARFLTKNCSQCCFASGSEGVFFFPLGKTWKDSIIKIPVGSVFFSPQSLVRPL